MFTMSVFVKLLMDLIPVRQGDRNWSKIGCGAIPNPVPDLNVKVTDNCCVKVLCLMFTMSVFVKLLMDFIPVRQGDRNWSKIVCGAIPNPVPDLNVKVTDNCCVKVLCLMFTMSVFVKPLMDLIPVRQGDRNWSKIVCGAILTQPSIRP